MKLAARSLILAASAILVLALPLGASANHHITGVSTHNASKNMHAIGQALFPVPLANAQPGSGVFNSDLAFWGDLVFQGTYNGFHIIDASEPGDPVTILDYNECSANIGGVPTSAGNQGDIVVWGDILVRAWNSNTTSASATCDGEVVPLGFEGLHIFDISNLTNPDLVASVDLPQGTHTLTAVPDLANNRLLVYGNSSSTANPGIDIVSVPLNNPAGATFLRFEPMGRSCHDVAVILGDAMLVACAGTTPTGQPGLTVSTLDPALGGSLTDPRELWQANVTNTTGGHTASFTWDGEVVILGTEPGGGSGARCTATGTQVTPTTVQTDEMKTIFFFDADTGSLLGEWVHERDQTVTENCTIHNLNVIPLRDRKGEPRYVLVSGNYQAGIAVVDFSDPANPFEIAYADPAPLINPDTPGGIELGGDWSTYWYNGFIYSSDILRGVFIWKLSDPAVAGAVKLPHLNPQTQEFTIGR